MSHRKPFTVITGSQPDPKMEHTNRVVYLQGASPWSQTTEIALNPSIILQLFKYFDYINQDPTHYYNHDAYTPAELLLRETMQKIEAASGQAIKLSTDNCKHIYDFAVPEFASNPLSVEKGKKIVSEWLATFEKEKLKSTFYHVMNFRHDSVGAPLTIFSRESEKCWPSKKQSSIGNHFNGRQRDAMNFFLHRLNVQMDALVNDKEPPFDFVHVDPELKRSINDTSNARPWHEKLATLRDWHSLGGRRD